MHDPPDLRASRHDQTFIQQLIYKFKLTGTSVNLEADIKQNSTLQVPCGKCSLQYILENASIQY